MAKTARGLVEYAKAQLGRPYWYGSFGQAASKELYNQIKNQYPKYYKWDYTPEVAGQKVHDCVGMIKGYLWSEHPNDTSVLKRYNEKQDISANMMRDACPVTGKISTIPEIPGMLVFKDGHVGIYEGNGNVIEARGHDYGVVRTRLASRSWTTWGRCPFIEYEGIILHRGIKNADVKAMQEKLISLKYDLGSSGADGSYGGATVRGVTSFQNDHGITPTGVFDEATKNALEKALAPAPVVTPKPTEPEKPVTQKPVPVEPPVVEPVVPDIPEDDSKDVTTEPTDTKALVEVEQAEEKEPTLADENASLLSKLLKLLIELVSKLLGKNN